MRIVNMNGKYYLLSDDGYILHSENTLTDMQAFCAENFAASLDSIVIDNSTVYHDDEHDNYITDQQLMDEFDNDFSLIDEYGTYWNYINECMDKNGTLSRVK